MTHRINICEYGQIHSQCKCPSPTKLVVDIKCDRVSEHKKLVEQSVKAEIDNETQIETNLYRLETFADRHTLSGAARSEVDKIATDLRAALDRAVPDSIA